MYNRKIKVLHLIESMNSGGAQRIVLNYLKDLSHDNQIELKVLVYNDKTNSYCNRIIEKENYNVDYLFNIHNRYIRKIKKTFLGKYKLKKYIQKYQPDIVHVHISSFLTVALDAIKKCNVPIRFDTLHSNPYRFNSKKLKVIQQAFQKDNFIGLCVTEEQVAQAKARYDIQRYEILRNGIDIENINKKKISKKDARKMLKLPNDKFIVIGVGRLDKNKRFDYLIEAFSHVLKYNNNSLLLIAGSGKEKNELIQLVNELKIEKNVKFLGDVDDMVSLYCAADVVGIPSNVESCSLVLLEAQICGLRCVISDGVPKESIISTKVKQLKKSSTSNEWAQALLDDNYLGKKVCNENDYDVHKNSEKLKKIYLKYWNEYKEKNKDVII